MKTFLDFEKEVKAGGKLRNVFFILSGDNYFINAASVLLREKLFGSKDSRENFFIKYADETSVQELRDLTNNYSSLFASSKIIILKRCEKYSRKLDELLEFLKTPDPDAYLLLCFDKEYVLDKKPDKNIEFYDFTELPGNDLKDWIRNKFKFYGKEIHDDAVEFMIDTFPGSFDVLNSEIDKITSYEPESSQAIDKELLLKFTGYEADFTPNELMRAIIRNDSVKAVQILDNLLHKAGLNEIYLVSIISNYYLDLLSVKSAKFRGNDSYSLFGKYKIWGERLNFAKEYSNIMDIKGIAKAIALLLDTDKKLKTSMLNSDILMTSLVEELSSL
jgi:DNA polymerase III subunit delta